MSSVTVTVGHSVTCQIVYLDQNGNPMLATPIPDSPPSWSNAADPTGCAVLTVAADALSATDAAVAVGQDVVSLSLSVSGTSFSATLPVTIEAAAQVLTSVQIAATVD